MKKTNAIEESWNRQCFEFARNPASYLDIGDMWDEELEWRANGGDRPAVCKCGAPEANTHAWGCNLK
jgi:hypothetical protein